MGSLRMLLSLNHRSLLNFNQQIQLSWKNRKTWNWDTHYSINRKKEDCKREYNELGGCLACLAGIAVAGNKRNEEMTKE